MRALYVSHNGMAENLGQSQVLPYLRGLARAGVEFDLISYELPSLSNERRGEIAADLERSSIRWHPLRRTLGGSLAVKLAEAQKGAALATRIAFERKPKIVHGRSYFPTAICDVAARASRHSKVLFDCRGMIGDEYVDCGYWTKDRVEYRLVKLYERRLFRSSDGMVVLTRALADWLRANDKLGRPTLEVIPCCVDMEKFRPLPEARARIRAELGTGERVVLAYAGSLGTWYLEPEMARFAAAFRQRLRSEGRDVAFVCLTPSDPSGLLTRLAAAGFGGDDVVVRKVAPPRMPEYLAAADVGLSFIQSCFSKKGSSPTKVAEYLAAGNVVVVNGDIGDQGDLAAEREACVVLEDFSDARVEQAAQRTTELVTRRSLEERTAATVDCARRHFGLAEVGVTRYTRLYERLAQQ